MAKNNNNLNLSIFAALKVAEKSGVPTLFLSNPGMGKTSSVDLFCKVRSTPEHPVVVELLRGNSTSAEEVMGYDVSPRDVTPDKPMSALHLRPSWFQKVLDNHEKGIRTVLFLDEITTANEFVQAALLHLIFERSCGHEKLPEDTLIVAAGNYIGNLTNSMSLLSPVMNRFDIINLFPDEKSLDIFLNKYEGALVNKDGNCKDYIADITKQMIEMDKQELSVDDATRNKIGEYFEKAIKDTANMLIKRGDIDFKVTDLQDIYTNTDSDKEFMNDSKVYGFVSLRTLCYLRDVTIAYYTCFGKKGISSDNYYSAIEGLCGLGLKKDKSGNVVKKRIASEFFDSMQVVLEDISKLNNSKIPVYTEFFEQMVKETKSFSVPAFQAMTNKFTELVNDPEVDVVRPISVELLVRISELTRDTGKTISSIHVPNGTKILDTISKEKFTGLVNYWNTMATFCSTINGMIQNSKFGYSSADTSKISGIFAPLNNTAFKLKSIRSLIVQEDNSLAEMIPSIKSLDK